MPLVADRNTQMKDGQLIAVPVAANAKIYAQLASLLGKYSKFASVAQKSAVRRTLSAQGAAPAAAANPAQETAQGA